MSVRFNPIFHNFSSSVYKQIIFFSEVCCLSLIDGLINLATVSIFFALKNLLHTFYMFEAAPILKTLILYQRHEIGAKRTGEVWICGSENLTLNELNIRITFFLKSLCRQEPTRSSTCLCDKSIRKEKKI